MDLGLLPDSDPEGWPEPDLASSVVRYLRACERVGHRKRPRDAKEALRQLRWASEERRLADWAWEDPSLRKLRTPQRLGAFAEAISPNGAFISKAKLRVRPPTSKGAPRDVDVELWAPDLSEATLDPGFEVEVATDKTGADRDAWKSWNRLRWRPPIERGKAVYHGVLEMESGESVLARVRARGMRSWIYVGKERYMADGLSEHRWVEPGRG